MTDPHDWFSADTLLHHKTSNRPLDRRKIGNNTYLERRHENAIAVKLHNTDVVIFNRDGTLTLNTGGWYTVTTKERINRYAGPFSVYSERGQWKIYATNPEGAHRKWSRQARLHRIDWIPFTLPQILADLRGETVESGMWTVRGIDGGFATSKDAEAAQETLIGPEPEWDDRLTIGDFYDGVLLDPTDPTKYYPSAELAKAERHDEKLIKQVNGYMRRLTPEKWAKIVADAQAYGTAGDCLYCQTRPVSAEADHLQSHLDERYYMVTLARNAIDVSGYNAQVYITDLKMVKRQLRKYFLSRLLEGNRQGRVGYKHDYGTKGWR